MDRWKDRQIDRQGNEKIGRRRRQIGKREDRQMDEKDRWVDETRKCKLASHFGDSHKNEKYDHREREINRKADREMYKQKQTDIHIDKQIS